MEKSTHLLTSASLKALAHPVRVSLLGLLRAEGASTATALAARLGESSGTTSYHLRQLASAGFVADEPGRGNGRERWWRAAQESTRLETSGIDDDPATQQAVDAYLGAVAHADWRRLEHWLRTSRTWSTAWQDATTVSDELLTLSPAELRELTDEIEALVARRRRPVREGDAQVAVQWQSFPLLTGGLG